MNASTCGRKLYDFDGDFFMGTRHWKDTSMCALRRLSRRVARDHGREPPLVRCARGRISYNYCNNIGLLRNHRNKVILLHELAHWLQGDRGYTHGPAFVRRYIGLLVRYLHCNEAELIFSATFTGVRIK